MRKTLEQLVSQAESDLGIHIKIVGIGRRAAYLAEETGEGFWLSRQDLVYARACRVTYGADAYSHWCTSTGRPMSAQTRRALFGS